VVTARPAARYDSVMALGRRCSLALAVLVVAPLAAVAADPEPADAPAPLEVRVGRVVGICKTGTILCPAGAATCDDTSIATPDADSDGLGFKGVKPGATLCSAAGAAGQGIRRVYRVTVKP
jgi:hypothetical protein